MVADTLSFVVPSMAFAAIDFNEIHADDLSDGAESNLYAMRRA